MYVDWIHKGYFAVEKQVLKVGFTAFSYTNIVLYWIDHGYYLDILQGGKFKSACDKTACQTNRCNTIDQ